MLFLTRHKTQHNIGYTKKGFTLIEALVSLGLFSIVVVAASGVILSVISSNKKNQAISSVVNNLNYSIESMVRDIKTGYGYQCDFTYDSSIMSSFLLENYKLLPENCNSTTPIDNITLVSTITGKEQIVRYELAGTGDDSYIKKTLYTQDDLGTTISLASYPLTDANNIKINSLGFTVSTPVPLIPTPIGGIISGQPSVFLVLTGETKINQINVSDFFIQTYISQRLPNFI